MNTCTNQTNHSGQQIVGLCTGSDELCDGNCYYWLSGLSWWKRWTYWIARPQPTCPQYQDIEICSECGGVIE